MTVGAGVSTAHTAADRRAAAAAPASSSRELRSIDFRRGDHGVGRLVVKLSDPRTAINLSQQGSQIIVNFADAGLPKKLARSYDTQDFGTPVTGFDAIRVGNDTHIVLNATGDFQQLAYQSDDEYVVEVQPLTKSAAAANDDKKIYNGEKLSLNFQDIDTRAVLQLLADASGQNIVVSDTVRGSVTLRLQSVPWDQALDIVLRTKGLDKRRDGNVIIVAPSEELASREKADLASKKDIQELAPLRTEYLQINYAKATDLARSSRAVPTRTRCSRRRGSVAVDERTNTLLLVDTSEGLDAIRKMVATLDIPVKQVLIESRLVIVNDDFERDLGVRAGYTGVHSNGNNGLFMTSGTAASTDTGLNSALSNLASNGTVNPVAVPTGDAAASRYNVNMPVANPGRQPGVPAAGFRLHRRSRAVGRAGRRPGRGGVLAARDHGQPEGSVHRAGYGNSVPGSRLERRDHGLVQEGGAVAEGHAADHAGQSHHPRSVCHQGQRRPGGGDLGRRQRALDRHPQDVHARDGRRRPDRGARRHPRDQSQRDGQEGALPGRHPGARPPVQDHDHDQQEE